MAGENRCWICAGTFAQPFPQVGDLITVDCTTCGIYQISRSLYASRFPLADAERYRFSYWTKQRTLEGRDPPRLVSSNIDAVIADLPKPPTHSKADLLLVSLTRLHPTPGQHFTLDLGREYSLACARNDGEASFFLRGLTERSYINAQGGPRGSTAYWITHAGWERAAQLALHPTVSRTGFVAMHFTDEMLAMYREAFSPAIARAGFEPRRSDLPTHNEQIDARIVAEIRQSRFVVADVTGARNGVYFEAGYALGLGRPVIWTCRRNAAEKDMHFDTRQYNHILWEAPADLAEQLYFRIAATI